MRLDVKQLKVQDVLCLFCLLLIFALTGFAQDKIVCDETTGGGERGTTYIEYAGLKLKNIEGKAFYPDGTGGRVIVEIFRDPSIRGSSNERFSASYYLQTENRIKSCESDADGKFTIKGLEDGFYILRIGNNKGDGFGPVYMFVEISHKKGKKKELEIELGQQI